MLGIGTTVMGVDDLARAMAFWSEALGYVPKRDDFDDTFAILVPPDGAAGAHLALMLSETPVQEKPRIHLDLYAGDKADQEAEVNRLVDLGAQRVDWQDYPPGADYIVLADTEGNRFCVIDTAADIAAEASTASVTRAAVTPSAIVGRPSGISPVRNAAYVSATNRSKQS